MTSLHVLYTINIPNILRPLRMLRDIMHISPAVEPRLNLKSDAMMLAYNKTPLTCFPCCRERWSLQSVAEGCAEVHEVGMY